MQPDASDGHSVDREVLYRELWETPGTQLAKKYGVSDVALGKACQRHNISLLLSFTNPGRVSLLVA
jgi:hypothetical protein